MRTFKFKLTTQIPLETLQSNAVTFGELKRDIENSSLGEKISFTRKSEVREGTTWIKTIKLIEKVNLWEFGDIDEASLPSGDNLIFFVTPIEHKGGINLPEDIENLHNKPLEDVLDEIEEWGYNELMSLGSKLNKNYNGNIYLLGKRADVLESIKDYFIEYNNNKVETNSNVSEVKELLQEATECILNAINLLEGLNQEEVVGGITLSELHNKALEIKRQLNN